MSTAPKDIEIIDEEEELRLDQEFKKQLEEETNATLDEDIKIRNMVNTFSDIRAYLENNALNTELFKDINTNTINNMIDYIYQP